MCQQVVDLVHVSYNLKFKKTLLVCNRELERSIYIYLKQFLRKQPLLQA